MARKASKSKPEPATQDATEPQESVNKSEAIRRAIAAGKDQPSNGVAYIRETFGLEISPTHFSAVKSTEGKKQGRITVKTKGRKPGRPAAEPKVAVPAASNGEAGLIETLEALKPLVASMGAEQVKRLVDLLG